MMERILKFPATLILIVVNVLVFGLSYILAGSFKEPGWTSTLVEMGALYNPYVFQGEWYRIFASMFLHGHILHLALNMIALFSMGSELEPILGTLKFFAIYIVTGIAAALASLYFNLFAIGVGASGAIFGLYGFFIILSIYAARRAVRSIRPIFFSFFFFLGINIIFAQVLHADMAAHIGGMIGGMLIAVAGYALHSFNTIRGEFIVLPILLVAFAIMPRYQVDYYRFYLNIMQAEDSAHVLSGRDLNDQQYSDALKKNRALWDSALTRLKRIQVPEELQSDTNKLRRYVTYSRKKEECFSMMIDRESYIYYDSVGVMNDSISEASNIEYHLYTGRHSAEAPEEELPPKATSQPVTVYYDRDWEEIPGPPAVYYRTGTRDSTGKWDGPVRDYYANGDVQMKGSYKAGLKDGIFLYYSNHRTYTAAGRFRKDRHIGKWETFHNNGKLESEVYYRDRYFLKSLFDSTGVQSVKDGTGHQIERYNNGVIKDEGSYTNGYKEGYWYGRHMSGEMYYEENYFHGRLVKGRSRSVQGSTVVYDETSLYPLPEGGQEKFRLYIVDAIRRANVTEHGKVSLTFRVTTDGRLVEIEPEDSDSPALEALAKEIVKNGPRWFPAKVHGQFPEEAYGYETFEF